MLKKIFVYFEIVRSLTKTIPISSTAKFLRGIKPLSYLKNSLHFNIFLFKPTINLPLFYRNVWQFEEKPTFHLFWTNVLMIFTLFLTRSNISRLFKFWIIKPFLFFFHSAFALHKFYDKISVLDHTKLTEVYGKKTFVN